MTVIRAATYTIEREDLTVDLVCFQHALQILGNRKLAGKLQGYIEATLDANPGIASAGAILPLGLTVSLPEFKAASPVQSTKRLWD